MRCTNTKVPKCVLRKVMLPPPCLAATRFPCQGAATVASFLSLPSETACVRIYKPTHRPFLFPFSLPNDSTVRSVLLFTFATQLGHRSSPARGELPLSPSRLQKFHGLDVPSHFTGASLWVFRLVPAIYYHHKAAMPVLMQTSFCKDAYGQNKLLEVEPVGKEDVCL